MNYFSLNTLLILATVGAIIVIGYYSLRTTLSRTTLKERLDRLSYKKAGKHRLLRVFTHHSIYEPPNNLTTAQNGAAPAGEEIRHFHEIVTAQTNRKFWTSPLFLECIGVLFKAYSEFNFLEQVVDCLAHTEDVDRVLLLRLETTKEGGTAFKVVRAARRRKKQRAAADNAPPPPLNDDDPADLAKQILPPFFGRTQYYLNRLEPFVTYERKGLQYHTAVFLPIFQYKEIPPAVAAAVQGTTPTGEPHKNPPAAVAPTLTNPTPHDAVSTHQADNLPLAAHHKGVYRVLGCIKLEKFLAEEAKPKIKLVKTSMSPAPSLAYFGRHAARYATLIEFLAAGQSCLQAFLGQRTYAHSKMLTPAYVETLLRALKVLTGAHDNNVTAPLAKTTPKVAPLPPFVVGIVSLGKIEAPANALQATIKALPEYLNERHPLGAELVLSFAKTSLYALAVTERSQKFLKDEFLTSLKESLRPLSPKPPQILMSIHPLALEKFTSFLAYETAG